MSGHGLKIKKARKARGWAQTALAKFIGVTQPTISRWEDGYPVDDKHVKAVADFIGTSEAEFKYGNIEKPGLNLVPVVGYVGAGEAVFVMSDQAPTVDLEYVSAPPNKGNQGLVALRIQGDSMRPLKPGSLVYYGDEPDGVPNECLNQLCVVQLTDGQLLIKELRRGHRPGHFILQSWSASTEPIDDAAVVWAARVVWIAPS